MFLNNFNLFLDINKNKLCYNSLTGRLYLLGSEAKKALNNLIKKGFKNNKNLIGIKENLTNFLLEKKIIFKNHQEASAFFEKTLKQINSRNKVGKIGLYINITGQCNLSCYYCINKESRKKKKHQQFTKKRVLKVFKALDFLKTQKSVRLSDTITLTGGEPLLCSKQILEAIFIQAKKRNFQISFISNGTLIAEKKHLLRKYSDIISRFQITIDGPENIHNKIRVWPECPKKSFNKVILGIKFLLTNKIPVTIRINVNRKNLEHLPRLIYDFQKMNWINQKKIKFHLAKIDNYFQKNKYNYEKSSELLKDVLALKNKKAVSFIIKNFSYPGIIKSIIDILVRKNLEQIKVDNLYCSSLKNKSFTFAPDKKIYACFLSPGEDVFAIGGYDPKFKLNKKKVSFLQNRTAENLKKCSACPAMFYCRGGCPYAALIKNKNIYTPICEENEKEIKQIFKLIKDYLPLFASKVKNSSVCQK